MRSAWKKQRKDQLKLAIKENAEVINFVNQTEAAFTKMCSLNFKIAVLHMLCDFSGNRTHQR